MSRSDEFFKIYFGWLIIKVYGWSRHLCRVKGVELNEQHAVSDPDRVADEVASLVQMSVSLSLSLSCVNALILVFSRIKHVSFSVNYISYDKYTP